MVNVDRSVRCRSPDPSTRRVAILALLTSYGVELSQLYQAPWIVGLRSTTLGGSAFDPMDLVAGSWSGL